MGSWNTQAASRRVTRTDACVTTYPHQPAGPFEPEEPAGNPGGPQHTGSHRSGRDQELLHHRPHRSRQVDAGRPDAAVHRRGGRPPDAGAVPGPDGHRARARHHHQEPGGPASLDQRQRAVRAQPHRHPRPRGLHLRGLPQPGRLRGRRAARRRGPGHRGADAGQPVPGAGRRPEDHPGTEQDRPPGGPARPLRGRDRRHHRLRPQRGAPGQRQDRRGRRAPAARDRPLGPAAGRRPGRPGPGADLRLGLRHLPRRRHLRAGRRRPADPARAQPDDVHRRCPRDPRGGSDLAGAHAERGPGRGRGRLPHHRGQGRPAGPRRRHRDQFRPPGRRGPGGLLPPQADGLLRPVPGGGRRLPGPAGRAGQAAAERRRARLRAGDEPRARVRLPLRLPRPAAHGDRP